MIQFDFFEFCNGYLLIWSLPPPPFLKIFVSLNVNLLRIFAE